jgi:hypothetical protein
MRMENEDEIKNEIAYEALGLTKEDLPSDDDLETILNDSSALSDDILKLMKLLKMEDTKANRIIAFTLFGYGKNVGEVYGNPMRNNQFKMFALKKLLGVKENDN